MKLDYIGSFETDGNLVVTDPCYELATWCATQMKVKPGNYHVHLITGKLKDPIFQWDELPGTFRNSQLMILHDKYQGKLEFKRKSSISVDSGQAGFFNLSHYRKPSENPIDLSGHQLSFCKNQIINGHSTIINNKKLLLEKDANELYSRMLKHFGNEEETVSWFTREIKSAEESIISFTKVLETREFPYYLELKQSNDFYEIMCDLTSRELQADVLSPYGVVSQAGIGDGGYSCYVAKNPKGEIVASYLDFVKLKDLKD